MQTNECCLSLPLRFRGLLPPSPKITRVYSESHCVSKVENKLQSFYLNAPDTLFVWSYMGDLMYDKEVYPHKQTAQSKAIPLNATNVQVATYGTAIKQKRVLRM
jgi:hypothetical protein